MKRLIRLGVFVAILAVLAMGTSFALAGGVKEALDNVIPGSNAVDHTKQLLDKDEVSSNVVVAASKSASLKGDGFAEDVSSQSSGDDMEITGAVESLTSDTIVVSGSTIMINGETEFEDEITVGDIVTVQVSPLQDGTLFAEEIELFSDEEDDMDEDDSGFDDDDEDSDDDEDDSEDDSDDDNDEDESEDQHEDDD
jgi:hypothetical protein